MGAQAATDTADHWYFSLGGDPQLYHGMHTVENTFVLSIPRRRQRQSPSRIRRRVFHIGYALIEGFVGEEWTKVVGKYF